MSFDALGTARKDTSNALARLLATLGGMDPFERIEELREAGKRRAEAEGRASQMEHTRKALLARIATEIAASRSKEKLSEAMLERLARADPRYQTHVDGYGEAVKQQTQADVDYWTIRAELAWLEKIVSHENALTRMDG